MRLGFANMSSGVFFYVVCPLSSNLVRSDQVDLADRCSEINAVFMQSSPVSFWTLNCIFYVSWSDMFRELPQIEDVVAIQNAYCPKSECGLHLKTGLHK